MDVITTVLFLLFISSGKGAKVWDVEGKEYLDFMAGISAVNQGHAHPKILAALETQARKVALTSRAFYNDQLGVWEKYLTDLIGFEKVLYMNTGAEAGESAVKIARRWAYEKKGVPDNQAKVLFPTHNFWGRSIAGCGFLG